MKTSNRVDPVPRVAAQPARRTGRAPREGALSRSAAKEAALLREARRFMGVAAGQLAAFIPPARALQRKLERTERYRRVLGNDDAEKEPAFALAGTLGVMLERDLEQVVAYLRRYATPRVAAAPSPTSP